jgi:hypothetical protein
MSSSSPPPSNGSWKRKFEALEAQYAISKNLGPNEKRCATLRSSSLCNSDAIILTSVTAGQVSLGRGLRRTVDMFSSARDLVEENDRRLELMAGDNCNELTLTYVPSSFH